MKKKFLVPSMSTLVSESLTKSASELEKMKKKIDFFRFYQNDPRLHNYMIIGGFPEALVHLKPHSLSFLVILKQFKSFFQNRIFDLENAIFAKMSFEQLQML